MAAFEYVALNAKGKNEKGLIEAETARQARQLLRDRSLMVTELKEVAEQRAGSGSEAGSSGLFKRSGGSLSAAELALFTRQLATLFRSGLPLDEALTVVAQQSESPKVQRITLGIRSRVTEGDSLASALEQFPNAFPILFRATIEAGEQAGKLDHVMERLADYVERSQEMASKVTQAAIYPIIMLVVATGVVMGMMTYVVPQVVEVFEGINAELPLLTRGMIGLSDFLRQAWPVIIFGGIAGVWLFRRTLRSNAAFRTRFHQSMLGWPVVGRIVRGANTGRFMRTLGILFGSGVPILEAMRIGAQVVENLPMREAIEDAAKRVREGAGLGRSLAASKLFPPIVVHLVSSGESSGRLGEMLERSADNQEKEVELRIGVLMKLMEPVMTVVMGGIVLVIVLAILLPIFDLNTLVK
ncbi:MAG: type II secretion system inner membrane protein GspF [Pseudomonadota bacterium]